MRIREARALFPDRHRGLLAAYGIEPGDYYLQVCRIEPENNPDVVVREYLATDAESPLVVVGGANYESAYFEGLKATADRRVRFLGPVYEPDAIEALFLGAKAYVHGHEVGGTNPSLVTAMGCGRLVLANDVRFNAEVLAGTDKSEDACGILVDLALEAGGRDNVTVVLAGFSIPG